MRKFSVLLLIAIFGFVSVTANAQDVKENVKAIVQEVQQDMEEVKLDDLPEAVKSTLAKKYGKQTPIKALKAKKDNTVIYYVKLQQDEEFETVMINAEGKVIVPDNKDKK